MKELTKEQRQIIENKIKQEVENFNTFLDKQYCIDKIYKTIINRIKSHYDIGFDFLTIIEKNITEIDQISYEVIAIEEIKQILNIEDNIRYISGVFYIFGLSGTNLKMQVQGVTDILLLFETYPLVFNHCIFTQRIGYFHQITNIKKISFLNCEFEEQIYLNFQECLDIFQMNNCTFKDRVVIKGKFNNNVYFNNSHFKNYVDFHACKFEKTASFYGVRFDKTPNFSQAVFQDSINLVNIKAKFDFQNLNTVIENRDKPKNETANDFRDSFRTFKNALIKDNNLLDASNFHKYELYCKEIELKFKKPKIFSREWMDKWQLFFYRKLCDHHTDLILNLRWLVVVVGFFVSVLFVLRYGDGNLLQFFNKDNDLLKMLKAMLNIKVLNDSNVTYLILLYSFIGLFFVRTFFIFYYLVIFILMLAMSPYNLFSVVNFVTKDQSSSSLENIIMVAYTLIMILVLFSLQKTARKNSIVPN
ncbi:TPA: pentapeptide repeat-containing protein [Campylobacter coli]|nr:pentapeptide repeat-containing protein [Campylobacter coli]